MRKTEPTVPYLPYNGVAPEKFHLSNLLYNMSRGDVTRKKIET